jgi:hypothetical protein
MRSGKWSLNETHEDVIKDRKRGVSIWAGTSGSAMDIIWAAYNCGMNAVQMEALAWCVFAFFQFMPTVVSPTHTFHEVMRGAAKIIEEIGGEMKFYVPQSVELPKADFLTFYST